MTFSIIARCRRSGQFGVAAVTAVPAVGKLLAYAAPGAGAVATQARLNPYLGLDGLKRLRDGLSAEAVVDELRGLDPAIERRQFAVIDAAGRSAAYTGAECLDWAGSLAGEQFRTQGNRLAGPQVLDAIATAMRRHPDADLADRLIEALEAGAGTGGDLEGEVSAAIYVVEREEYPLWDIRVDEHQDPITELRRLHGIFTRDLLPEIRRMPTRDQPGGCVGDWCA